MRAATVFAVAITSAGAAMAAGTGDGLLNDRFTVSLGTFLLDTKTTIRVNGSAGDSGNEVDFGRDLGLKDSDRFRVDATWRFAERHKLRLMYFDTTRSRTTTIDRDLEIGDTIFPVNGEVTAKSSAKIAELAYEYVAVQRDNWELSVTGGVHRVSFRFRVEGDGTVAGQSGQFSTETATTKAPLPVFGLHAMRAIGNDWYLDGAAQFFALKVGKYDGSISDLRIGVTRMFGDHIGVGVGYDRFTTRLKVDSLAFDGKLRWRYSGAQAFLTASF